MQYFRSLQTRPQNVLLSQGHTKLERDPLNTYIQHMIESRGGGGALQ